jgi:hypothetical protein
VDKGDREGTETATTTNITHTRMATMQSDNEMSVRYPHCRNQETRLTREMYRVARTLLEDRTRLEEK